jgi:hypothetical protein
MQHMPVDTADNRAAVLVIAPFLAAVLCLAQDKIFAGAATGQSASPTGEQEWERIDRFNVVAVRDFLARHPNSPIREKIEHRLVLMEKMEAIESGKRSAVTIPFSTLAPWLGKWFAEHPPDIEKTVCRYLIWRSEGLMGTSSGTMLGEPRCASRPRENGFLSPVLGRGTIVGIRTNEVEYRWPEEGGTFVSDGESTLLFGALPKMGGLVFLEGKGRFIAFDGTQFELSEE